MECDYCWENIGVEWVEAPTGDDHPGLYFCDQRCSDQYHDRKENEESKQDEINDHIKARRGL